MNKRRLQTRIHSRLHERRRSHVTATWLHVEPGAEDKPPDLGVLMKPKSCDRTAEAFKTL